MYYSSTTENGSYDLWGENWVRVCAVRRCGNVRVSVIWGGGARGCGGATRRLRTNSCPAAASLRATPCGGLRRETWGGARSARDELASERGGVARGGGDW
ncbi:hypothetical protein ACSQ67_002802 [Phaseolus vulgaris]